MTALCLAIAAAAAQAFDFKGLVLGAHVTADEVEARMKGGELEGVQCGAGDGATVCNGITTVVHNAGRVNIVISEKGRLQRLLLTELDSSNFSEIAAELSRKFGAPKRSGSAVQNRIGAQYQQVDLVWADKSGQRIRFTKFAGSLDYSSLSFTTAEDDALMRRLQQERKGDL